MASLFILSRIIIACIVHITKTALHHISMYYFTCAIFGIPGCEYGITIKPCINSQWHIHQSVLVHKNTFIIIIMML